MPTTHPTNPARWLAGLSAAGLLMYAVPTLLNPPAITPAILVSGNFQGIEMSRLWGVVQTGGALLYASALLPLVVLYAVAEMRIRLQMEAVAATDSLATASQ